MSILIPENKLSFVTASFVTRQDIVNSPIFVMPENEFPVRLVIVSGMVNVSKLKPLNT